jgi:RES domain-containing protein
MKVQSWRLVKAKYASEAFSGKGAFDVGGRWNSPRVYVVYTSQSLSLASLEILAGGAPIALLSNYVKIPVEFDESVIKPVQKLSKDWNAYPAKYETKLIGDEWANSNESVVLKVPSAVVPGEFNYMINPLHPDMKKGLTIGKPEKYSFDKRIIDQLK